MGDKNGDIQRWTLAKVLREAKEDESVSFIFLACSLVVDCVHVVTCLQK